MNLKYLGAALAVFAPLTLGLPALAQPAAEEPVEIRISQTDQRSELIRAFGFSQYNYWDARVLADFWDADVLEAKATIGSKVNGGPTTKALLEQILLDARVQALPQADQLRLYSDSGFGYDDTRLLSSFWGDESPYETKIRIERNLIMGNDDLVRRALELAKEI